MSKSKNKAAKENNNTKPSKENSTEIKNVDPENNISVDENSVVETSEEVLSEDTIQTDEVVDAPITEELTEIGMDETSLDETNSEEDKSAEDTVEKNETSDEGVTEPTEEDAEPTGDVAEPTEEDKEPTEEDAKEPESLQDAITQDQSLESEQNDPKETTSAQVLEEVKAPQNEWVGRLLPVAVLCAICMVAALLLSLTNELTAPIIASNTEFAEQQSMRALIPDADKFTELELSDETVALTDKAFVATNGEEVVGYIVTTASKGYGGDVPLIVSFDAQGALAGISIGDNSETPGIGDRIYDEGFTSQFVGLTTVLPQSEYDGITGATYSSGAVYESVNKALSVITTVIAGEE